MIRLSFDANVREESSVTRWLEQKVAKFSQIVAKKIAEQKNAKISTTKPILKLKIPTTKHFSNFKISTSNQLLKLLI